MLCGSLDGRGIWGIVDTCVCVAESLCCPLETIMTLLIGYTPKGTVKFFLKKKKKQRKTRINNIIKNTGELFYIKRPKKYDSQRQCGNFDWETEATQM